MLLKEYTGSTAPTAICVVEALRLVAGGQLVEALRLVASGQLVEALRLADLLVSALTQPQIQRHERDRQPGEQNQHNRRFDV